MPNYGEEKRRGFYLRDGGYYFAISDYLDLRVTGDIYSKGSFAERLRRIITKDTPITVA